MFKWFNFLRLPETVCTDTIFVNKPCVATGATCGQVFYGVRSKMINIYGMTTKGEAHDSYLDFIREEGIPQCLHRDNSGEQNDHQFTATNRKFHVRDTTTEPYHPHQNPAETRAIRFLKRAGKVLMIMSGAPPEVWLFAMKYVAQINNWTSHESLNWKTPFEKRHGMQPDISSLLAFRFFQPVYYYVEDGFPDSGEQLGYILGVNDNVGSHMTFDLLTDDKQTVITRSVLRAAVEPVPNLRLNPSDALDPAIRIRDRDDAQDDIAPNEADPTMDPALEGLAVDTQELQPEIDPGAALPVLRPRWVLRGGDGHVRARMVLDGHDAPPRDPNNIEQDRANRRLIDRIRRLEEPLVVEPMAFDPAAEIPPLLHPDDHGFEAQVRQLGADIAGQRNFEPADMDIFVDQPLPMHRRKRRRRKKPKRSAKPKPSVHDSRRKKTNVSADNKHSPSASREQKTKIKRLKDQPTGNVTLVTTPDADDEDEEFVINDILGHRRNVTTGEYEVLISWEGYDASENSWEPVATIKETAAETLADYATKVGLSEQSGWKWTSNLESESLTTPMDPQSTPVEGESTQPIQTRRSTRQTKSKAFSVRSYISSLTEKLYNRLGLFFDDTTSSNPLQQYMNDMADNETPSEVDQDLPLESSIYDDPTKNFNCNLLKTLELQELDRHIDGTDDWDVVKVLDHATRRTTRRLPGKYSRSETIKDKHTRLQVMFKDGTTQWVPMDALLLQDPTPVIEYVKKNKLSKKKKFKQVRELIMDEEKLRTARRAYKAKVQNVAKYQFGVEIPRNSKHADELDRINGNNLWAEATKKEMDSIRKHEVFRLVTQDDDLREYKRIPYQVIYAAKHDQRRKARIVAGGHMTDPPAEDVYSGVVGMDTVRLAFAVGAMQGLDVCACDISTAFLYGKTKEKVYIVAGPEFGPELEGKRLIVQGNWYGLKSAAATYHSVASAVLRKMGFTPTKVDANLWMRRKGDHYEYIAIYVDDLLAWGRNPIEIIQEVQKSFKLQGIGFPDYYLGADVNSVNEARLKAKGVILGLSAKTYITNALEKLQSLFGGGPFHKARTPMMETYHPESDDSPLLGHEDISKYRTMLGSANWIVTLGRFDIAYATSTLARYSLAPREGHLNAMKRIFGYLRVYPKGELMINTTPFDHPKPKNTDGIWEEYYPDAEEELPPDQPAPLPTKAQITIYVDADHAHDTVTRRSVTGIMIFVNQTLVKYVSKRQKTVETSSYGSELVAARVAVELAMEYRYCLRMLGVEIDGPCRMFGDNNSVILNTTLPSSMLKKKHQSIAYHAIRMAQAANIIIFEHVRSEDNWADVLTKPLSPVKFMSLVRPLLFQRSGSQSED